MWSHKRQVSHLPNSTKLNLRIKKLEEPKWENMTEPKWEGKSTLKEEKAKRKKTQQKRKRKHGGGKNGIQISCNFFLPLYVLLITTYNVLLFVINKRTKFKYNILNVVSYVPLLRFCYVNT